jgi:hypothetical protein
VSFFRGDGRGGFTLRGNAAVGEATSGLAVAQLTADRVPDLLVSNAAGDVLVLVGVGDGTFRIPTAPPGASVPFAAGDLNGDGLPDVVAAREATGELALRLRIPGTNDFVAADLAQGRSSDRPSPAGVRGRPRWPRWPRPRRRQHRRQQRPRLPARQPDGRLVTRPLSFAAGTNPSASPRTT